MSRDVSLIDPAILSKTQLLGQLAPSELGELLAHARIEHYEARVPIFSKGDPGDCLYAILDGRVGITTISDRGKEIVLNILAAGDVFGEIALLDGKPRTASAVAIEAVRLLRINRADFLAFLESHSKVSIQLILVLCQRLRWVSDIVEATAFLDVPRRLALKLLLLADTCGQPVPGGTRIDLKLSQEELGHMVGATRESINKSLRDLLGTGVIAYDAGHIVILRRVELEGILGNHALGGL